MKNIGLALPAIGALSALILWMLGLVTVPRPMVLAILAILGILGAGVSAFLVARSLVPRRGDRWTSKDTRGLIARGILGMATLVLVLDFLAGILTSRAEVAAWNFADPRGGDESSLRLICFNVRHGYPDFVDQEARYHSLLEALRALSADVVVLQEAWSTRWHGMLAERFAKDLGMNGVYTRANGSLRFLGFEEGSAILSRHPVRRARRIPLAPRTPFWENRVALEAKVEIGSKELAIAGVHLSSFGEEVRRRQAACLRQALAGVDVVAGDFNAGDGSDAVLVFTGRGFADAVPGGIDHVLLSREGSWEIESASWSLRPEDLLDLIGPRAVLSDHPGILVDLRPRR